MLPIAPLMIEHRLIERVIGMMSAERDRIVEGNAANPFFIARCVDFLRSYADRTHHGKEEDILFVQLRKKELSAAHRQMMEGLERDHVRARLTVKALVEANEQQLGGSAASAEIGRLLGELCDLYPRHIKLEDKEFFVPVMGYFNAHEQASMLARFYEFDRTLIHEHYKKLVDGMQ